MGYMDSRIVESSAPGKIFLFGGYSILEPNSRGLVTTVDNYVHVKVSGNNEKKLKINAVDFDAVHESYISIDGKITNPSNEKLNLISKSVEVALKYALEEGFKIEGINIESRNDPAFATKINGNNIKSGLGSSAAVTVATISAVLSYYGFDVVHNKDKVHKLAQIAHALVNKKIGSGFDIAAAVYGNIIYQRYSPSILSALNDDYNGHLLKELVDKSWDYKIDPIKISKINIAYANFITGSTSTNSMVSIVNKFKEREPARYKDIIERLDRANRNAIDAFVALNNGDTSKENIERLRYNAELGRYITKELGILSNAEIESHESSILIDNSKLFGSALFAKLPGSGGNDAIAAFCLSNTDKKKVVDFWSKRSELKVLDVDISNDGYFTNNL